MRDPCLQDLVTDLPEGVVLLDPEVERFPVLIRAVKALRGSRGDRIHPMAGVTAHPSPASFTLLRLADPEDGGGIAGYMTARLDRQGRDIRTHVRTVFTDIRHRRRGVARDLAEALSGISLRALLDERDRYPEYGIPAHHVVFTPVSLGGEKVCRYVDDRIQGAIALERMRIPVLSRRTSEMKRPYFGSCVGWPYEKMPALEFLVEHGEEIDRQDFLASVDRAAMRRLESMLGYGRQGLSMEEDFHVRYFREPRSHVPFLCHSAIEHVFARDTDIERLLEMASEPDAPLLVVVHPGSLFGSADMNIGPEAAGEARRRVFEEIYTHDGPIVVIDGALSDEISPSDRAILEEALEDAACNRDLAMRLWGDDAGMAPPSDWSGRGRLPGSPSLAFDSQMDAARALLQGFPDLLARRRCVVTGAWASDDGMSGCVNAVADVLREMAGPGGDIRVSEAAARLEAVPQVDDMEI